MAKKQSVLLFDLGGVILESLGFQEWRKLLNDTTSTGDELKSGWLRSPVCMAFEKGEISPQEFAQGLVDEFALSVDAAHILRVYPDWVLGFYPGADRLLAGLRNTHRIACLSNTNELHWRAEWAAHFDDAFVSHFIGMVKPDPDIYRHVVDALDCDAADILFFDDSTINVVAARDAGLDAHRTDGFDALQSTLRRLEIL